MRKSADANAGEILQLHASKRQRVASRPSCAVALRDALLKLFRAGHIIMTLDVLMQRLEQLRKAASGLAKRETVERALRWLAANDTICSYAQDTAGGQWVIRCTI